MGTLDFEKIGDFLLELLRMFDRIHNPDVYQTILPGKI